MNSKDTQKISDLMTENDLFKLRSDLGHGYVRDLQRLCQKIYKKKYSESYLRKALRKEYASDKIIKAAITLRNQRIEENREFINNYLR